MIFKKHIHVRQLVRLAALLFIPVTVLTAYPILSFEEQEEWIEEGQDIEIVLTLNERSYLPVEVPFKIDTESTADLQLDYDSDEEDNDYYIVESDDEDNGYLWDSETKTGKWIFSPGQTTITFTAYTLDDENWEDTESIKFSIIEDEVTVARPVEPLTYTLLILDNEEGSPSETIELNYTELTVAEGDSFSMSVSMGSYAEETISVDYYIEYGTADANDLDLENSSVSGSMDIDVDYSTASTVIYLSEDLDIEDEEETLYFHITSAYGEDTGKDYNIGIDEAIITILDNDPTTLSFSLTDDDENYYSVTEGSTASITINLSGGVEDVSAAFPEDVDIPISISGTADEGADTDEVNDCDFYITSDLPLTISDGSTYVTFYIYTNNDDLIEDDETIIVTMGTPVMVDSNTPVTVEGPTEFTITLEDNDPVSLNIGKYNADYDADDEDSDEPYYLSSSESLITEPTGGMTIPVYLSDYIVHDLTFDLILDVDNTTATMYDPEYDNEDEDQDWDYQLASSTDAIIPTETTIEVTIPAGYTEAQISLYLNDDGESKYVPGQSPPDDVEGDETVRFSIANLQSDSETLTLGDTTSHVVTIKEMPELDVTELFKSIAVDTSNWIDGQPPFNKTTSLHELILEMIPPDSYDHDLTGYNSYKVVFNLGNYDPDNPDDPDNDPLYSSPAYPEENEYFEYYVENPYTLRYPTGYQLNVIKEGEEQENENYFDENNADIIESAEFFYWPLNLPALNEDYAFETDQTLHSPYDTIRWNLDFTNGGNSNFPVDRLDLDKFPDNIRIYLTPDAGSASTSSGTSTSILRLEEEEDGRIFLEADTSYATSVQVQYLDESGDWKYALPEVIETSGSRFFWSDRGPPATDSHPSEVPYRIYRVILNP